jgi:hypothetical protein
MTTFASRHKRLLVVLALVVLIGLGSVLWYRQRYPYGYSHCCIKAMMFALEQYAYDHDGRYPAEEATPEASLGLLHDAPYDMDAENLRGKTVPVEVVRGILDRGGRLGPDSCGWHYVEGLTENDDRRLAILCDKVGLGHFGERYGGGSREVVFVGGSIQLISAADWPGFQEEQQRLLARRDPLAIRGGAVLAATVKLPNGDITDHVDSPFRMEEEYVSATMSSKGGGRSGPKLRPADLRWMGKDLIPDEEGTKTIVLSLPEKRWRSRPVTVKTANGRATPSSFVFEMEEIPQP